MPLINAAADGAIKSRRVTSPPASVRDRILERALAGLANEAAAHPLDNDRLEREAAAWLRRLAGSKTFLASPTHTSVSHKRTSFRQGRTR
jgi:hypothetical protein